MLDAFIVRDDVAYAARGIRGRGDPSERWGFDRLNVFAWLQPEETDPELLIVHEGGSELRLTFREAQELAQRIGEIIDEVERPV